MSWSILCADVLEGLAALPDASFDACLCDPPYGLKFMGKSWDDPGSFVERSPERANSWDRVGGNHNPTNAKDRARTRLVEGRRMQAWCETWAAELIRVLKPGAFLFAFGGSRTYHRLACAIEDAGFEIRDSILVPGLAWAYGSGFPKSLDISKAIGGAAGADRPVIGSKLTGPGCAFNSDGPRDLPITGAATAAAAAWDGYGTALKPAWEPVVVAMRPLDGTFAGNALEHGVAGLNIDGGRVGANRSQQKRKGSGSVGAGRERGINLVDAGGGRTPDGRNLAKILERQKRYRESESRAYTAGRWPPNLAFVHSPDDGPDCCAPSCPVRQLDEQAGERSSGGATGLRRGIGFKGGAQGTAAGDGWAPDSGSASRFFYCSKVSRSERERGLLGSIRCAHCGGLDSTEHALPDGRTVPCSRNLHPTLKPIDLCRWLATLLLPPKRSEGEAPRRLLVPFSGSGSEIAGAVLAGWDQAVGIERSPLDCLVSRYRVAAVDPRAILAERPRMATIEGPLFEAAS